MYICTVDSRGFRA